MGRKTRTGVAGEESRAGDGGLWGDGRQASQNRGLERMGQKLLANR